jgi:exonuclease III
VPGVSAPLPARDFKNLDLELWIVNNLIFLIFSGVGEDTEHRSGVGILMNKEARRSLMEWSPILERIILAHFKTKIHNLTIIQCYAPTETTDKDMKEKLYQQLHEIITVVQKRDVIIVMGDMNAKIGPNNEGLEHVIGRHRVGNKNENELFSELCADCDLIIGGTVFPHKTCHKVSWVSPDNIMENQIDHIAISKRFRRSLLIVRNKRGAEIGSDHHLMIANFRFKILTARKKIEARRKKYYVQKLQMPSLREELKLELKNRSSVLSTQNEDTDIEER